MKAKVEFSIEISVDRSGYTLLNLSERCIEASGFTPKETCDCVANDIEATGINEWVERNIADAPNTKGIYTFTGIGVFDEDSSDYKTTLHKQFICSNRKSFAKYNQRRLEHLNRTNNKSHKKLFYFLLRLETRRLTKFFEQFDM